MKDKAQFWLLIALIFGSISLGLNLARLVAPAHDIQCKEVKK